MDHWCAIWAGFAGAGGVVGLLSSGLLLERYWWGSIFAVNLPIAVALLAAVLWLVPTSRDPEATPFDPVGAVLSIVGLSGLVFGVIEGAEKGWLSGVALGGFLAALVGLGGFVLWELRTDHPLLDPRFFRHREFSMGSFAITVTFFGIFGMFFVITQFFQFVQGHDALATGLRITPYAVVLLVAAPMAATAVERFGARLVTIVGAVFAGVGFLALAQLSAQSSYPAVAAGLVAVSIGTGLLMPPATTALVASLPPAKAGVGSAMNDVTREVGGALGIAVVGALLSIGYENAVDGELDALSADAAEVGADSFGGLLAVTSELDPETAQGLIETGRQAFVDGQQLGLSVAGVLMFAVAAVFLVRREAPGPQSASLTEGVPA